LSNKIYSEPYVGIQHFTCPFCKHATPVSLSYELTAGIRNYHPTSYSVPCVNCKKSLEIVFRYIEREGLDGDA
jgi:transcription elongation factor Elf1